MNKCITALLLIVVSYAKGQVDMHSGGASINFPLFNIQDNQSGLNTDVSLDYTTGNGLKVNSIASNTGTGWDLNVGGVIERSVIGQPDDQVCPYNTGVSEKNVLGANEHNFSDGYQNSLYSPLDPVPGYCVWKPMFPPPIAPSKPALRTSGDLEMDIFTFCFDGKTGRFFIGKNKQILQLTDSKLSISFTEQDMISQGIRTRINKFIIIDENGLRYTFSEMEISYLMNYRANQTPQEGPSSIGNYFVSDGHELSTLAIPKIVNKWFLSSIENPVTNQKIEFTYETYFVNIIGSVHLTNNNGMLRERLKYEGKRITVIKVPNNQYLYFFYNPTIRIDLSGDNPLDKIELRSSNNGIEKSIYSYTFTYGYFYKNEIRPFDFTWLNQDQKKYARLCLQSFQRSAPLSTAFPSTKFEYFLQNPKNSTGIVPPPFFASQDDGGFYSHEYPTYSVQSEADLNVFGVFSLNSAATGVPNNDRHIDEKAAAIGCIKKIGYPSGNSIEFEYEQNIAIESNYSQKFAWGIRVNKVSYANNGDVMTKEYKYIKENGITSGMGYEIPQHSTSAITRIYSTSENVKPASIATEIASVEASAILRSGLQNVIDAPVKNAAARGFERGGQAGADWAGQNAMSGAMGTALSVTMIVLDFVISDYVNSIIYSFSALYEDHTSSSLEWDNINLGNPIPIIYSRVIEETKGVDKSTGAVTSNGSVIFEFTSYDDYPILQANFAAPYSSKQRIKPGVYGLPKKIQYRDKYNNLLKETNNIYSETSVQHTESNFASKHWIANINVFGNYQYNPDGYTATSMITDDTYYPFTEKIELSKTIQKNYDQTGNVSTATSEYIYNSNNLPRKIFATVSDLKQKGTNTFYSSDYWDTYTSNTALQTQKQYNIYGAPYVIITWYKPTAASTDYYITNISITEYDPVTLKPTNIKSAKLNAPIQASQSDIDNFDPFTSAILSGISFDIDKHIVYGDYMPIEVWSDNNTSVNSIKYNYITFLPAATISNSSYGNVSYTSFENSFQDSWQITTTSVAEDASAMTGRYIYHLTSGTPISRINLATSLKYFLTVWAKTGGSVLVNNSGGTVLTTANGWQLLQFSITGASAVTVSGTGDIDELRLFPDGASMTTTTYEPLVGVTSTCDAFNNIIYYEYDEWYRVSVMRNRDKNILKKYCYNNAGIPGNCDGIVFLSTMQVGQFYRNNCGANSTGSTYTYTLAAGAFSSIISLQDADQKAKAFFFTNGPLQANDYILNGTTCTASNCQISNCPDIPGTKCVNGLCEVGKKITTSSVAHKVVLQNSEYWEYLCTFHYVWTDCSFSVDYNETKTVPTPVKTYQCHPYYIPN